MNKICNYYNKYDLSWINKRKPTTTYHYTDKEALESILKNKKMWFSDRTCMDDISEGIYTLNLCLENIKEICPNDSELMKEMKTKIESELEKYKHKESNHCTYICCFSIEGDGLSLWTGYAKPGGYNIRFNTNRLEESFKETISADKGDLIFQSGKVIYNKKLQIKCIKEIVTDFYNNFRGYNKGILSYFIIQKIEFAGTFFKDKNFRDEREYRMAFSAISEYDEDNKCVILPAITECNKSINVQKRKKEDLIIPYISMSFNHVCATGITVHPLTTGGIKLQEDEILQKNNTLKEIICIDEYKGIRILSSNIPLRSYESTQTH